MCRVDDQVPSLRVRAADDGEADGPRWVVPRVPNSAGAPTGCATISRLSSTGAEAVLSLLVLAAWAALLATLSMRIFRRAAVS